MKKLLLLILLLSPLALLAESFKDVAVIDVMCSEKKRANPEDHTRACLQQCEKSGYGILTADGRFLKFDSSGNSRMSELLRSTEKKNHWRVNVEGQVSGDKIEVRSLNWS